jgi:coenzyme F420-reducing hydrogenase gamma subunit
MKTQFDFHYTDTDEPQPDVVLPVEFQIQVDWNLSPEKKDLITATIEKIVNNEEPEEFIFEFWFTDVKDVPDKYDWHVGEDDECQLDHDHLTTGFEWCEDEIKEHIIDNRASWVKA